MLEFGRLYTHASRLLYFHHFLSDSQRESEKDSFHLFLDPLRFWHARSMGSHTLPDSDVKKFVHQCHHYWMS